MTDVAAADEEQATNTFSVEQTQRKPSEAPSGTDVKPIPTSDAASPFESLCREAAAGHGLDGDLVAAICCGASSWDPWRVEYDGMFYVSHVAPLVENRFLTNLTEARARAFRWGLMGILGHRARLAGYDRSLPELLEPSVGLDVGCRLLSQMLASMPEGTDPVQHWRIWQTRGV
jgi:hypothetical protein